MINQDDGITVLVNLHTLDTARADCHRIIATRCSAGYKTLDDMKAVVMATPTGATAPCRGA